MRRTLALAWILVLLAPLACALAAPADDLYTLGPDSAAHPGVPQGKITGPMTLPSSVFPGTSHTYWVYVPAQYDPATPASLMIFLDGHAFVDRLGAYRIPNVLDNLIYRREMPVTIAVFINPGRRPDQPEPTDSNWGDDTSNRHLEYCALDDKFPRVVTDELMPELAKMYNITRDANGHAIAGSSSGGIGAFTVAWQRPDVFRKVICCVGNFTNVMGGNLYPDLIRQNAAKPIRIYLQDGVGDTRNPADATLDYHTQNIRIAEALTEKKYDLNYTWGIGGHSNKQGAAEFPEMLRWLWHDYPRTDDPTDLPGHQPLGPGGKPDVIDPPRADGSGGAAPRADPAATTPPRPRISAWPSPNRSGL